MSLPLYPCVPPCFLQLARAFKGVQEGVSAGTIADDDVREILTKGQLYLYNVASPALGLQQLIVTLIDEQRERLLGALAGEGPVLTHTHSRAVSASDEV